MRQGPPRPEPASERGGGTATRTRDPCWQRPTGSRTPSCHEATVEGKAGTPRVGPPGSCKASVPSHDACCGYFGNQEDQRENDTGSRHGRIGSLTARTPPSPGPCGTPLKGSRRWSFGPGRKRDQDVRREGVTGPRTGAAAPHRERRGPVPCVVDSAAPGLLCPSRTPGTRAHLGGVEWPPEGDGWARKGSVTRTLARPQHTVDDRSILTKNVKEGKKN